jgi:hypothetical protein
MIESPYWRALTDCRSQLERCYSLCCDSQVYSPEIQTWARGRVIDFGLWAAGVGAFAVGESSLENRLAYSEETLDATTCLLESLVIAVRKLVDGALLRGLFDIDHRTKVGAAQGAEANETSVPASITDSARLYLRNLSSRDDTASEACTDVEALMKCLIDLGYLIKEASRSSRFRRSDMTFEKEKYTGLLKHLETVLRSKAHLDGMSTGSDITQSLFSVRLSPGQYHLIEANLRRRHRFACAQQRFNQYQTNEPSSPKNAPAEVDLLQATRRSPPSSEQEHTSRSDADQTLTKDPPRQPKRVTFAPSTVEPEKLRGKVTRTGQKATKSDGSSIALTSPMTSVAAEMSYPRPPAISDDHTVQAFSCPCCYETLNVSTARSSTTWK